MNPTKHFLLTICFSLLLINCAQINEPPEKNLSNYPIPDSIIHKTNMIIIIKVGQKFFDTYIKFDSNASKYSLPDTLCVKHPEQCVDYLTRPYYFLSYKFNLTTDKEFAYSINIIVDTTGTLIPEHESIPLPTCPNNNCWNRYKITSKEQVINIAQQYEFKEGIKEWEVQFFFNYRDFNNYVWVVKNTLWEDKSNPHEYAASGEILYINAFDGTILYVTLWYEIT